MKYKDFFKEIETHPDFIEGKKALSTRFALGNAILQARLNRGWSQSYLAKLVGTKQANISRIESANANPTLDLIHRILRVLELNIVFASTVAVSSENVGVPIYVDYGGHAVPWPTSSAAIQNRGAATNFVEATSRYRMIQEAEGRNG